MRGKREEEGLRDLKREEEEDGRGHESAGCVSEDYFLFTFGLLY